ncbi:MAG: hypothetical protein M1365_10370 [Actinobacteria bacterium]|nr:hypothetical protein [Actinomycetota bacterium]
MKTSFKTLSSDKYKLAKIRFKTCPALSLFSVILIILSLLSFSLFLSSCTQLGALKDNILNKFTNSKDEESAVKTVKDFFNALIGKNYEAAFQNIYNPGGKKSLDDFKNELAGMTDIVSIDTNWVEIKNNVAIVGIDLIDTYDNEEKLYKDMRVSLLKDEEDGIWKINFWN